MPRYYFHIEDNGYARDEDGYELVDTAAACREAMLFAGELLRDGGKDGTLERLWRLCVTDSAGSTVFALSIAAGGPV